jgi:uncharacterized protein with LGFP repeats
VTSELGTPDGVGRYNHFQGGSIYWTASTGAFAVQGAIRNEWAAEGWERSPMGYPLTDESGTPDGIGRYNHFQGGSIYWTAATDAHEVQGAIHTKWAQLGWERSALGYPTTNESGTPDGIGRFNHFQGGSIYWTAATDAHEVQDAIYNKWAAMGWERSALGYPLTDESGTPDGVGRFNHFQGGSIYWTAATGAHEVEGEIHTKWAQLGWETMLGYPITDETATPDGVGQYSQFEHGFIFWSPSSGAHDILGAIFNKWVTFAAEAGELGYPTSDETATTCGGGRKNAFQGGAVYWTAALGAHVVPGAVRTMYTSLQAECGSLGFPTGDPATLGDGGVLYAFEHGALILSPSGVVTVQ